MTYIIAIIGAATLIIGGIGFIISAFRTGILLGLAVFLFYPAAIVYLLFHWQDAKGPFQLQILGLIIVVVAIYMDDEATYTASPNSTLSGEISSSTLPSLHKLITLNL